jgi:hypothetical protein
MSTLDDIRREIDYQTNSISYDKETDIYKTNRVHKFKTINLYLFYLFYIVLFVTAGFWVVQNIQTLLSGTRESMKPILFFIGIMGMLILYPLWSHVLFSYIKDCCKGLPSFKTLLV